MPEVSRINRAQPQEAIIDLGDGDALTMVFDANKITPRWRTDVVGRLKQGDVLSVCDALAAVLISWDVTQDGQPFPPLSENIADFSESVVGELFEQVCDASMPSDAEGNASSPSANDQSLASAQESPTSRNGSDGLISQPSSASLSKT